MEYENATNRQCLNPDIISNIPQNIIKSILSLMPLRDAVRTSVLSKKWQYSWLGMPKLIFTNDMVKLPSSSGCIQSKCKLAKAIFHVLLLHKGPQKLWFHVGALHMESEFAQMISYLAMRNCVKELSFTNTNRSYKLPFSFYSLQGLEYVVLQNCTFEPPLTFSKFSCLRLLFFLDVDVSAQILHRFLSNCLLLKKLYLVKYQEGIGFVAGENIFTFVDLFQCLPSIQILEISNYYIKYLSAGGMPHRLPTSLVCLKDLSLEVCLTEQNEISSALCIIRSSPELVQIRFVMYRDEKLPVQQTPPNFLIQKTTRI